MSGTRSTGIGLAGLTIAPAQVWGAVRLVPLLRTEPINDLRLHARAHEPGEVRVGQVDPDGTQVAYVPHAFVANWSTDGGPVAAYGTQLRAASDPAVPDGIGVRYPRRSGRREERQRFLPLPLAQEGYLALHFGGPSIAWREWTQQAIIRGVTSRVAAAYAGADLPGLEDALRVFEIHPGQCGLLIYVADVLGAAFIAPHPDDYRALHPTLLADLYGELLYQYAHLYPAVPDYSVRLDERRIGNLADLRAQIAQAGEDWANFHTAMADGLLVAARPAFTPVYRMGRFALARFLPAFDPHTENHIGELITDEAGRTAYLKSYRLSAAQVRRGHLLSRLAEHDWELTATAATLGTDRAELVSRLDRVGFGHLLRPDILDQCRAQVRRAGR